MMAREVRIEEGRNYIGEDRVDKMVVTIKLVILAEECGGVSRRREAWRCFKTARSVEVFRREVWRCFKTARRVLMAGHEQELHRPLSGRSEGNTRRR